MAKIVAVEIDVHEPTPKGWGELPVVKHSLETGDYKLWRDDGHVVIVERKAVSDLLGSIADGRVFQQVARLAELASETTWVYVMVTGEIETLDNRVVTKRGVTGWNFRSVNGALLTMQEVGVPVAFGDDGTLAQDLITLAERSHNGVKVSPKRDIALISTAAAFLAGIPGIGEKRAVEIVQRAAGNLAHALIWLTDTDAGDKGWNAIKSNAKAFLGLAEDERLEIMRK
jgi:ERCC4-type nuclease